MGLCPVVFRQGQVLLADFQTAVAAVWRVVAGKQQPVGTRRGCNAVVRVGLLRVKVKGKQQVGPFKYDNLVVVVFVQQTQVVAVQQVMGYGHLNHIVVKTGQKSVF